MFKRVTYVLLSLAFVLTFVACGGKKEEEEEELAPKGAATTAANAPAAWPTGDDGSSMLRRAALSSARHSRSHPFASNRSRLVDQVSTMPLVGVDPVVRCHLGDRCSSWRVSQRIQQGRRGAYSLLESLAAPVSGRPDGGGRLSLGPSAFNRHITQEVGSERTQLPVSLRPR